MRGRKVTKAMWDIAIPIGTRRIHEASPGLLYWVVKTGGSGRWVYEHRLIAAKILGRPLLRSEHVHHVNRDTLDNREENLRIVSHAEHMRAHGDMVGWSKLYKACVLCGKTSSKHASRGRCTRCYQEIKARAKGILPRKAKA